MLLTKRILIILIKAMLTPKVGRKVLVLKHSRMEISIQGNIMRMLEMVLVWRYTKVVTSILENRKMV
jgi:hypothetical protein